MKVFYYSQHVLGIGHVHRSLEICRRLAENHDVSLICGGAPLTIEERGVSIVQLPGLVMDADFSGLLPWDSQLTLEETKQRRLDMFLELIASHRPQVFITELFPFGRKAFRFELEPVLKALKDQHPSCLCLCSVRDILVEKKEGQQKHEAKVVKTLNKFFDGVLVHSDPAVISLDTTFSLLHELRIPIHYTGFVAPPAPKSRQPAVRSQLRLDESKKLIVATIGGGGVGIELLRAAVAALEYLSPAEQPFLQIFHGPYCPAPEVAALRERASAIVSVDRFTDSLPDWLSTADLSLSMAGYNTCMNLAKAGIPALVYPFSQNQEQRMRAQRLSRFCPMHLLGADDLKPSRLAGHIKEALTWRRQVAAIDLDGAGKTAQIVSQMAEERK